MTHHHLTRGHLRRRWRLSSARTQLGHIQMIPSGPHRRACRRTPLPARAQETIHNSNNNPADQDGKVDLDLGHYRTPLVDLGQSFRRAVTQIHPEQGHPSGVLSRDPQPLPARVAVPCRPRVAGHDMVTVCLECRPSHCRAGQVTVLEEHRLGIPCVVRFNQIPGLRGAIDSVSALPSACRVGCASPVLASDAQRGCSKFSPLEHGRRT
jgi:hypothetical protein